MNYEELLEKYMQHVRSCESIDYVDQIGDYCSDVIFTDEEKTELQRIRDESFQ